MKKIRKIENNDFPDITIGYLEGAILGDTMFITNGRCLYIDKKIDKIYVEEKEEQKKIEY